MALRGVHEVLHGAHVALRGAHVALHGAHVVLHGAHVARRGPRVAPVAPAGAQGSTPGNSCPTRKQLPGAPATLRRAGVPPGGRHVAPVRRRWPPLARMRRCVAARGPPVHAGFHPKQLMANS